MLVPVLCIFLYSFFYFFFQAEDGIRDLVRSRGLGDVYKRQVSTWEAQKGENATVKFSVKNQGQSTIDGNSMYVVVDIENKLIGNNATAVSYTHLTLPTIYSV